MIASRDAGIVTVNSRVTGLAPATAAASSSSVPAWRRAASTVVTQNGSATKGAATIAAAVEKGAGDLKQLVGDACAPGVDPTRAGEALTVNDFSFNCFRMLPLPSINWKELMTEPGS